MENKPELMTRKPDWLKISLPQGKEYLNVKDVIARKKLHTICVSGKCPNMSECWGRGTATFMILGDICTRNCKFCGVKTGKPLPPDEDEPRKVAESIKIMGLKHCVITSVDRDDLADQGAGIWVRTIKEIKKINPEIKIEVLIPDFRGDENLIKKVLDASPDVVSHNLETVERLTPLIRSAAKYHRSLDVLRFISKNDKIAKSGIMLGLGETKEEVLQTMDDLRNAGCKVMTIGQYLAPSKNHMPVVEYVRPEQFDEYHTIGIAKGFSFVESAPLVRSSYRAEEHVNA